MPKNKTENQKNSLPHTLCKFAGVWFFIFLFPVLACTRSASTPAELTAIALRVDMYRTPTATITPIPSRTHTATPAFTEIPVSTNTPDQRSTLSVDIKAPTDPADFANGISEAPVTTPTPTIIYDDLRASSDRSLIYTVQQGDTLENLCSRFKIKPEDILSNDPLKEKKFLKPGTSLLIRVQDHLYSKGRRILPDEYVVMGYPSIGYDIEEEVNRSNGFLASYSEYVGTTGTLSGTEIIRKVSEDYSISPILLLELLEYRSHWVSGYPTTPQEEQYPIGWLEESSKGLYKQLAWAAQELSKGYYGWRYGQLNEIPFYKNPLPEEPIYFSPQLNAGSAAIQYLFAQLFTYDNFEDAIYGDSGFLNRFYLDFGNVWDSYITPPNGFNDQLTQPTFTLPFYEHDKWSLTGGPHEAWTTGSPLGALDFAPQMAEHGCAKSNAWITSIAPGLVVRSSTGEVVVDLDMDGHEETGWVILYLHVSTEDRVEVGTQLPLHGRIGHPSCEGGSATGTHLHIARKYNGEWVNAFGPLPFDLSGWIPFGGNSYKGGIIRGDETIFANSFAQADTLVHY